MKLIGIKPEVFDTLIKYLRGAGGSTTINSSTPKDISGNSMMILIAITTDRYSYIIT